MTVLTVSCGLLRFCWAVSGIAATAAAIKASVGLRYLILWTWRKPGPSGPGGSHAVCGCLVDGRHVGLWKSAQLGLGGISVAIGALEDLAMPVSDTLNRSNMDLDIETTCSAHCDAAEVASDRKSTRLNSSHRCIS